MMTYGLYIGRDGDQEAAAFRLGPRLRSCRHGPFSVTLHPEDARGLIGEDRLEVAFGDTVLGIGTVGNRLSDSNAFFLRVDGAVWRFYLRRVEYRYTRIGWYVAGAVSRKPLRDWRIYGHFFD